MGADNGDTSDLFYSWRFSEHEPEAWLHTLRDNTKGSDINPKM
jgi:hypothetical protein